MLIDMLFETRYRVREGKSRRMKCKRAVYVAERSVHVKIEVNQHAILHLWVEMTCLL